MTVRREISEITAADAWEGYVGSQTPMEFMKISKEIGETSVEDACLRYAKDLPNIFPEECSDLTTDEMQTIADRLAEFVRSQQI